MVIVSSFQGHIAGFQILLFNDGHLTALESFKMDK